MSVINTNLASLNAQRNLSTSSASLNTSIQRLSSGLRVNSAKDDAAGLSIATKMDSQIRGMNQAIRNANDGISMAQTADGGLATAIDALQRMRELAVQGANQTMKDGGTEADRKNLSKEFEQLQAELGRIASDTKFNGRAILGGDKDTFDIQVGADSGSAVIQIPETDLAGAVAGDVDAATIKVDTSANSLLAVAAIDTALDAINTMRADLGAAQNRLGFAVSNLQSASENQSAAKSRIMDTDFAAETAKLTRGQILQQAGTAMLAQANSAPNGVMALLRG
ncbi:flagellin [Massilia varians]|uniref:Flagellin n=1 Tax=Massilia varians TaxID=457921 RepID=A0ABN6TFW2_9BURK|nr:flagellin [Massilia varians]BDT60556.1 flagellin [Massilia varians]